VEYHDRLRQWDVCAATGGNQSGGGVAPSYQRLQQEALEVERPTISRSRDEPVINGEAVRRIQRDLDHAEARLHAHE
jgi:hypothetical protein